RLTTADHETHGIAGRASGRRVRLSALEVDRGGVSRAIATRHTVLVDEGGGHLPRLLRSVRFEHQRPSPARLDPDAIGQSHHTRLPATLVRREPYLVDEPSVR